jgi:hypothetical protein
MRNRLIGVMLACAFAFVPACKSVTDISLDATSASQGIFTQFDSYTLSVGQITYGSCGSGIMQAVISGPAISGGTISYQSLNTSIATVDANGVIHGVSAGTATIRGTITVNGVSHTKDFVITVTGCSAPVQSVTSVTINIGSVSGSTGFGCPTFALSYQLTASALTGASVMSSDPSLFYWVNTNQQLAKVDQNGLLTLTPGATGLSTVTASLKTDQTKFVSIPINISATPCSAQPTPTVLTASPNVLNFTLCPFGQTGTSGAQQITLFVDGKPQVGTEVLYKQASQLLSITPNGLATPAQLGTGTLLLAPKSEPTRDLPIGVSVTNTGCSGGTTTTTITSSLTSVNIANCSGFQQNYTPNVYANGVLTTAGITWTSENTSIATTNGSNGFSLTGQTGSTNVVATVNGASVKIPITVTTCNNGGGTNTVTSSLTGVNVANCSGFTSSYTPPIFVNNVASQAASWTFNTTSSGGSIGSQTSNGFTLNGVVGMGNAVATIANVGSVTIPVSVTACNNGGGVTPTVTTTPAILNLTFGSSTNGSAQIVASVSNGSTAGSWTTDSNCANLSTNGLTVTVTATRVCTGVRVRYTLTTGQFGESTMNAASGASSCISANADGSTVYTDPVGKQFAVNGSCVYQGSPQRPYWYSLTASHFTVVGAPFVCVIDGVGYACGTSATIKAIAPGQDGICDQAAVQDPTVKFCRVYTATAGASGNLIPSDGPAQFSIPLLGKPRDGATISKVYTWEEYKAIHSK